MTTQSQLPLKWYVPFATGDATRVEIPVTSADPTRASQTLGFPPLTMQPPESGGVPPQGEDFNGGMNQIARICWWMLNGGMFVYDSTFASNSNINGYPNSAVLMRSDFAGIWLNQADSNQVNPDTATGAVASNNWVPLAPPYGRLNLTTLTGGTLTLTYAQAAFDRLILGGTLTSNQTVIVPNWIKRWLVVNNTTGNFTLTVQPVGGAAVNIPQNASETAIVCDGTNLTLPYLSVNAAVQATQPPQMGQIQTQAGTAFAAAGTAPAYTLTPSPAIAAYAANQRFRVAFAANGTLGSNTLAINGLAAIGLRQYDGAGNLVPATIVAGMLTDVEYNGTYMVVLDPLTPSQGVVGQSRNAGMAVTAASASALWSATELVMETALGGGVYKVANPSATINLATTGANGMDTGTAPVSGWVGIYGIYNPTTNTFALLATNATAAAVNETYSGANMPAGYTASALVAVWNTNASSQFTEGRMKDRRVSYSPRSEISISSSTAGTVQSGTITDLPKNARFCNGFMGVTATTAAAFAVSVADDVLTDGNQQFLTTVTGSGSYGIPFRGLAISVAQAIFYAYALTSGTASMSIALTGYEF